MVHHVTMETKKVKEIKVILANNPRIAINSQNHLQFLTTETKMNLI